MASFLGTSGDDTIAWFEVSAGVVANPPGSSPGNDSDTIVAGDGDDTIFPAGGDDHVEAGDGDDDIVPASGDDYVEAGDGDDEISEFNTGIGSGSDEFYGEGGNDTISGGEGDDQIDGGDGDDRLFGGEESEPYEEDGDDVIFGRAGNDYLAGGRGADELDGGDGDDMLFGDRERDSIALRDTSANILRGGAGNDHVYGALGADWLHGNLGNDVVDGDDGDDTMLGGSGNDTLYGGAGDDRLNGGEGNDYLEGGDGVDRYAGLEGNDEFHVRDFDDSGQNLVLRSELVDGGKGRDTLFIDLTDLTINLGKGIVRWGGAPSVTMTLRSIEDVQCGSDVTVVGSNAANQIWGSGDQTFRGLGGNDFLFSDNGALRAYGGTGADTLVGGRDTDRLYGDEGADVLHGRNGDDWLYGGAGNDELYGNTGYGVGGGEGSDVLFGGAGRDLLNGNYRADNLYGGAGRDTFLFTDPADSKYGDIDHIRGGAPRQGPEDGAVKAAFEAPGAGAGDIIDLKAIDADDSRNGNQPFIFHSQGQGGLWLKDIGTVTVVLGNIDHDDTAEFVLYIHDGKDVMAEDYTAADFML